MLALSRLFLALALTTVTACATGGHQAMSGSVIMKVSDTEAHVCVFGRDVPVGSHVQLYRHTCAAVAGGRGYRCEKQPVAVGTVAELVAGHYARVTFPQGTTYAEGYTVEPIN